MKSFASRPWPAVVFTILTLLSPVGFAADEVPADGLILAFRGIERSIQAGQLEQAEAQLAAFKRQAIPGDTRVEQAQRLLADAQIRRGTQALAAGDLDSAARALGSARALMPSAPALTGGLEQSIESMQQAQREAAERARAEQAAKAAAAKAEQARQAAERAQRAAQAKALPAAAPTPAAPRPRLIDPALDSSRIEMAMLDQDDREAARELLEQVAADVVAYHCTVGVQVRESRDYPWVAAVLAARVKKLDPTFPLELAQQVAPDQVPSLQLSPRR